MAVDEGTFRLYSRIEPPLTAGDYRLTSTQDLRASKPGRSFEPADLPVEALDTHVRVRSPQYQLPPDQVLSTFPPAGTEGAYGSRLPQVVIRRRTLPWERSVGDGHEQEPWLALVLIAEGEAAIRLNEPVASCVTTGVDLDEPADSELGNCLAIRKSVVDRIFPTHEEVRLLAHAREVDIHDTELMMGDDDGFLAVVISNRLPLPGRDAEGNEVPVKYLPCLVNLCGQFEDLLDKAPEPRGFTIMPVAEAEMSLVTLADIDHASMGSVQYAAGTRLLDGVLPKAAPGKQPTRATTAALDQTMATPYEPQAGWAKQGAAKGISDIYSEMAQPFRSGVVSGYLGTGGGMTLLDRELVFPVLLHWSFTSTGQLTFRRLMEGLNSGLLGTQGTADATGRPPFESVETGHVGLAHRTRRGDPVRSWYRGPLVPHPTADGPEGRLPLAHAADQIRVVVPDGREDISLAAAFEIGRLLALSRPSMVSSLMRWRQLGFQAAQLKAVFAGEGSILEELEQHGLVVDRDIGGMLGAVLAGAIAEQPGLFLGEPSPLVDPGRPVLTDVAANTVLATGFGFNPKVLSGTADSVLGSLQTTPVKVPRGDLPADVNGIRQVLTPRLRQRFEAIATDAVLTDGVEDRIDVVIKARRAGRATAPEGEGEDR